MSPDMSQHGITLLCLQCILLMSVELHDWTQPTSALCAGKHMLRCRPQALALNCNSTRMSVIDLHGVLSFYDFHVPPQQPGAQGSGVPTSGEHLAVERKVSPMTTCIDGYFSNSSCDRRNSNLMFI